MLRHLRGTRALALVVVCAVGLVAACSDDGEPDATGGTRSAPEGALVVPDDHPTIQEAVDAASEGDLVYVREGTYRESVTISTPNLVLRGADRNATVIDGDFERENCVTIPETNGVAVENLTVANCNTNGIYFIGADGFRVSYVNSVRAGYYGIYAYESINGRFEQSYAAGSADAGFYVGNCDPCNVVVEGVLAEWNGLGYSGTNASGTFIVDSTWRENRSGIVPNNFSTQPHHPQQGAVIAGNLVHDNNNSDAPAIDIAERTLGMGIVIAGGNDNLVARNRVESHDVAGIAVFPIEYVLRPGRARADGNVASGNRVVDNVLAGESTWDVVVVPSWRDPVNSAGNCVQGNSPTVTGPADLEALAPCDSDPSPDFAAPTDALAEVVLADQPDGVPFEDARLPSYEGEQMPDADSAPPRPATPENLELDVDVDAITTPPAGED